MPRTPRVVEFLRKVLEWQALLASGQAKNQADIARREGISRVRVTQVMGLLHLAPEIQQRILFMPDTTHRSPITERSLRSMERLTSLQEQLQMFQKMLAQDPPQQRSLHAD